MCSNKKKYIYKRRRKIKDVQNKIISVKYRSTEYFCWYYILSMNSENIDADSDVFV